jgi:2-keto-4-pentenoate hydratase/2-oxohepta-3-ene-1,7-dioic acid hydratase in catechol pathway
MRLLTFHAAGRERYGVANDGGVIDLSVRLGDRAPTLAALIESGALDKTESLTAGAAPDFNLSEIEFLPPIPKPGKIICIGVNYGDRNAEYRDDSAAPKYPSVFMRTAESLVGHAQPIMRPPESEQLDYEGEIVLVIGKAGRRIAREAAWDHVAGLSLMNEGSVRDWLRHAKFNVTQGKNFERSGSWGPWIQTPEDLPLAATLHLTTRVNSELRQDDTTANLIFPFDYLISYLSSFMPLQPGDIIATGTPTGAGARFDPPKYLRDGDVVTVSVEEIGLLENRIEDEFLGKI